MNGIETETGRRYVALFIDWDNLAISTSADMGGAVPDLGRIVQRSREIGTILLAKAYAEWSVTSERLAVYRAGVEPAYAPTFRFEPDPSAPNVRSKSLADPCMVTDCVETLHLLPAITDFVIVTGDKDLIPVVRLAQLRGKKVTVIGPDFSANVLKEMADDFVSYRSLVEEGDGHVPVGRGRVPGRGEKPVGEPIAEARRLSRGPARPAEAAPALQPARGMGRGEPSSRPEGGRGQRRAIPAPVAPPPVAVTEPAARPVPPPPPPPVVSREEPTTPPDLNAVFSSIADLLTQRAAEGKARVRATAIKDALLQAYPGFNERIYGFPKFKDLLDAAQKDGLINIIRVGPVHWATLNTRSEAALAPSEAFSTAIMEATPATAVVPPPASPSEERLRELIHFMLDLRNRSRWLTYTYVLTNLTTMLAETMPAAAAETEARDLLSAMTQQGILRIDTEPREIDVNGTKHRIRMCHLVDEHPLVAEVLRETAGPAVPEAEETGEPIAAAQPVPPEDEVVPAMATAITTGGYGVPSGAVSEVEAEVGAPAAEWPVSLAGEEAEAEEESLGAPAEEAEETPRRPRRRGSRGGARRSAARAGRLAPQAEEAGGEGQELVHASVEATVIEPAAETPAADRYVGVAVRIPVAMPAGAAPAEPAAAGETLEPPEATVMPPAAMEPGLEPTPSGDRAAAGPADREAAFQAVARLVRENTNEARPRLRAPGLKQRLMRALGHFDEHDYGFSRFGDFLEAAQQAGYLAVQREGSAVWVSPPATE